MTSPPGAEPAVGPCPLQSSDPFSPPKAADPTSHSPPGGTRTARTAQRGGAWDPPLSAGEPRGLPSPSRSPPPSGAGGGGARSTTHAPPRTRLPSALAPLPARPGGGGAAGGLRGCDAPGAAAALASGRSGAGCWERCSGGAAGTAASREPSARRGKLRAFRAPRPGPPALPSRRRRRRPLRLLRAAPPPFPSPSRSPPGCAARTAERGARRRRRRLSEGRGPAPARPLTGGPPRAALAAREAPPRLREAQTRRGRRSAARCSGNRGGAGGRRGAARRPRGLGLDPEVRRFPPSGR